MNSNIRIHDMPVGERPRERLVQLGADKLKSSELIAILLRTGIPGQSAVAIGEQLVSQYGSLQNLARASLDELRQVKGIGRDKAIALICAFNLARRMAEEMNREPPLLDTAERVAALLREDNRLREVEHFQVVLLNTRRKLIRVDHLSQGTRDTLLVHPAEVLKLAILANASAIVLVHNHPSGDPSPSEADIKVTRDLIRAGHLLRIEVLDHVILGRKSQEQPKDYASLRELGYFA